MNELQAIIEAYEETKTRGHRTALATVVSVTGSAYRRPGAHMLISETGQTTGTISGGCLERDVVERAKKVMASKLPTIVEYDTRGDEESVWGLGMGCNGVIRILIESLDKSSAAEALQFMKSCVHSRIKAVIATVVEASPVETNSGHALNEVGQRFCFTEDDLKSTTEFTGNGFMQSIWEDARLALEGRRSVTRAYQADEIEVLFDVLLPPRALTIFGAEHDALPLVRLAKSLGWYVTVIDVKNRQATYERFEDADRIILCRATDVNSQSNSASETAVVVMTHSYTDDVELLKTLLPSSAVYVGVLGPAKRTAKLLRDISREGIVLTASQLGRLHAPVGVDIGAETADEIALAILAEINAVDSGRSAGFLRDREAPIHDDDFVLPGSIISTFTSEISDSPTTTHFANASL